MNPFSYIIIVDEVLGLYESEPIYHRAELGVAYKNGVQWALHSQPNEYFIQYFPFTEILRKSFYIVRDRGELIGNELSSAKDEGI